MPDAQPTRLLALDGLRGVAAALVLAHHLGPAATGHAVLPGGFLAVDFFFMLSGFVICQNYERRIRAGWRLGPFIVARLVRLYPTIAMGVIAGGVVALLEGSPAPTTLAALVSGLTFAPRLDGSSRGVFRLDGVEWSLLFELFANILHHRLIAGFSNRRLAWFVGGSLILLALMASRFGTVAVGDRADVFFAGFARVVFPYSAGVLLARWLDRPRPTATPIDGRVSTVLLLLVIGAAGVAPSGCSAWWIEVGVIAVAFPAIILLGARSALTGEPARWARIAGDWSYPLYAIHLPATGLVVYALLPLLGHGATLFFIAAITAVASAGLVQRHTPRVRLSDRGSRLIQAFE